MRITFIAMINPFSFVNINNIAIASSAIEYTEMCMYIYTVQLKLFGGRKSGELQEIHQKFPS